MTKKVNNSRDTDVYGDPVQRNRTLGEEYFEPGGYIRGIKYITEKTTLYSLHKHGYIKTYLFNRLCGAQRFGKLKALNTIGELLDVPLVELWAFPNFGRGCQQDLRKFFEEHHDKFKLKDRHKIVKNKKISDEQIIQSLQERLHNQIFMPEKLNQDRIDALEERIKQKDIEIGRLKLSENEAYKALKLLKKRHDKTKIKTETDHR